MFTQRHTHHNSIRPLNQRRNTTPQRQRVTPINTSHRVPTKHTLFTGIRIRHSQHTIPNHRHRTNNSKNNTVNKRRIFNHSSTRKQKRSTHRRQRHISTQVISTNTTKLRSPILTKIRLTRVLTPSSISTSRTTIHRPITNHIRTKHMLQVPNHRRRTTNINNSTIRHIRFDSHHTKKLFRRRITTHRRHHTNRIGTSLQQNTRHSHNSIKTHLRRHNRVNGNLSPHRTTNQVSNHNRNGNNQNHSNQRILITNSLTRPRSNRKHNNTNIDNYRSRPPPHNDHTKGRDPHQYQPPKHTNRESTHVHPTKTKQQTTDQPTNTPIHRQRYPSTNNKQTHPTQSYHQSTPQPTNHQPPVPTQYTTPQYREPSPASTHQGSTPYQ